MITIIIFVIGDANNITRRSFGQNFCRPRNSKDKHRTEDGRNFKNEYRICDQLQKILQAKNFSSSVLVRAQWGPASPFLLPHPLFIHCITTGVRRPRLRSTSAEHHQDKVEMVRFSHPDVRCRYEHIFGINIETALYKGESDLVSFPC